MSKQGPQASAQWALAISIASFLLAWHVYRLSIKPFQMKKHLEGMKEAHFSLIKSGRVIQSVKSLTGTIGGYLLLLNRKWSSL